MVTSCPPFWTQDQYFLLLLMWRHSHVLEPSQFLYTRVYIRRFPQQNQALFFCVVLLNEYSYTHFNEIVLNNCC